MDGRESRVEELFHAALEREPPQREAFLRAACAGDQGLLDETLALLGHADSRGDVLDRGAPTVAIAQALAGAGDEPERIGPYRVLATLGRGSFGVVYKVEQREPVRRVLALKVIKRGMDTAQVVARFEAERQALALLDHRGVAKVFDAGQTEDGRPYFALEYVPGIPITDYADRHRLGTEQRLRLFLKVCAAVQHAHQKGIVHRDLKPTNILVKVEGEGLEPVVIDFGLAKALTTRLGQRTLATRQGYFVGTLEYASPEQVRSDGLDIDTRTDIYALGVLLYKLLTGELPIDSQTLQRAGPLELQRLICELEPPRPSRLVERRGAGSSEAARSRGSDPGSLARRLRGDLDWIVLKALAKDRTRRYPAASELAADIERHLADEPVGAAPPELSYRAAKFVRRNRVLVAASALVALALVVAVAGTWAAWKRAAAARDQALRAGAEAEHEAEIARAINDYLRRMLSAANPWAEFGDSLRARETRVSEVLDQAARAAERSFADLPLVGAAVRSTLGLNYRDMGLLEEAERELRAALEVQRRELGTLHADTLETTSALASAVMSLGRNEEGRALSEQALEGFRGLLGERDPKTLYERGQLAEAHMQMGAFARAVELSREALEGLRALVGLEDPATQRVMNTLAQSLRQSGSYAEAEAIMVELYELNLRLHGEAHPNTAAAMAGLGALCSDLERKVEAEDYLRAAVQVCLDTLGEEHPQSLISILNLGNFLRNAGQTTEARELLERCQELCSRLLGPDHPYSLIARSNLGLVLVSERRFGEAEGVFRDCLARSERGGRKGVGSLIYRSNLAYALQSLGRIDEAEQLYRGVHEARAQVLGEEHPESLHAAHELAVCLMQQGKFDQAEPLLRHVVERGSVVLPENHPGRRDALRNLESLLRATGGE